MDAIIGTAGWSIARADAADFAAEGTSLERYAGAFRGVEVNSSFHRPHRPSTWAKWAAAVPDDFRFAVKIPKTITHQAKLVDAAPLVAQFATEIAPLGEKLGVVLVQLPPKLGFDAGVAERFFADVRQRIDADIVCEPRNPAWFEDEADAILVRLGVARAAADPALSPAAGRPGGWLGLAYWRLHGSPAMYRSAYTDPQLDAYAAQIRAALHEERPGWCMFDNSAASAATGNALALMAKLHP
jgi:uncharacterized protein YecE (DUF72 family)